MKRRRYFLLSLITSFFALSVLIPAHAQLLGSQQVYMEDMTWQEIQKRVSSGATIAIVPTGGTEQNGPQMVTGKHNVIVHYTAGEIAQRLGNAMVAPVIAYTPEGRIDPPEGHMLFAGTFSLQAETFALLLEDTANSLKQHGFKLICFIGDHGGSQEVQSRVADQLTRAWQSSGVRVVNVSDYYAQNGQEEWVESIGLRSQDALAHAALADTSEMMALDPSGVRGDLRGAHTEADYRATGASGDSTQASISYGKKLLSLKINAAIKQIHGFMAQPDQE